MKNQYVGDIGDFGKYSMLRAFVDAGVKVGVNWYLTENDGSNDGKFTDYLNKGKMRRYCPEIFDALIDIADKKDKSVTDIEDSGILPGVRFYSNILKPDGTPGDREQERSYWFQESMHELADSELIFMDPDNGLLESDDPTKLGGEKYVLPSEVESYFIEGHNVVYYCHKGRRPYAQWEAHKSLMFERIKDAKPAILTYHKGSQRSYIFLIHEENFVKYRKIIDRLLSGWYKIFSEEYTSKGNPADEAVGEALVIEREDGSRYTIEKRADGRIQMKSSKEPNATRIVTVDMFLRDIGF
ncbi:MAG: hypothetical protein J6I76_06205 [Oribacterium sp.]|nr:hypothetical protein [Oribacterium sp.]